MEAAPHQHEELLKEHFKGPPLYVHEFATQVILRADGQTFSVGEFRVHQKRLAESKEAIAQSGSVLHLDPQNAVTKYLAKLDEMSGDGIRIPRH